MGQFKVPRSRSGRLHRQLSNELIAAIKPVLYGKYEDGLRTVAEAETAFSKRMNKEHAVGVSSGTSGLFLALKACGVGPKDEVITVANSDISTTAAISHCGARFVLCDVCEDDHNMNPESMEELITDRTRAVVPVDLYGHPSDAKMIREIADKYGLSVVQDAALATGAKDHKKPVGAFSDIAVFSLSPYKPMGSVGSAGMAVTDDDDLAYQLRLYSGYGKSEEVDPPGPGKYAHIAEGYNLSLDPLHAAITQVKLQYLKKHTRARRQIADYYREKFCTHNLDEVRLPKFRDESEPTFRSYTILVDDRDQIYKAMRARGIEVTLNYVPPIHQQPVYEGGVRCGDLSVTEELARRLLCLPVDPLMRREEVDVVLEVLVDSIRSSR